MKILVTGILILSTLGVRAAELFESNLSVRALGMGNAFVGVGNNTDALFYNPARLAFNDGFNFRLLSPYLTASDPLKLKENVLDSGTGDIVDTVNKLFDENASAGLGTQLAFTMPRFGVAVFGDGQVAINIDNPAFPEVGIRSVVDYGGVVGTAIPIVPGILDLGIAIKRVIRQGGTFDISATTLAELDLDLIQDEINREGSAFGLDLGLTTSIPGPIDASASFVWKNVGGLAFTQTGGSGKPTSEDDEMIIGFAAGFDLPLIGGTIALDYKHLGESDVQLGKKINLGVELNLLTFDIRAGFHQGYYTIGAGLDLGLIKLDVATYGVELGEFAGQRIDRRYALQLTIELGVDPFFSLSGSSSGGKGGSKRTKRRPGIKQRR